MIHCIKYLSSLNLINLANHIAGRNFLGAEDSNSDSSFDRLFKWKSFKNGFEEARSTKKPVFLLIHKLSCPACQKLKHKFSKSVQLMDLSDRFVMINMEMGSNTILNEKKFQPDGKYVPRILFYTPDGDLIEEAYNKHAKADKEHKYFYSSPSQIADTMMYVLKKCSKEPMLVTFDQRRSQQSKNCDVDDDIFAPTLLH